MKGLTVSSRRSDLKRWPFSVVPHDVAAFAMITMIALSCRRVVDDKMRLTKKHFMQQLPCKLKILQFLQNNLLSRKLKNERILEELFMQYQ